MSANVKNLYRGLGSVYAVKEQLVQRPDSDQETITAILAFHKAMLDLHTSDDRQECFLAMVASMLNRDITKTGYLWFVNDNHRLDRQYYSSDSERQMLADLASVG